MAKLLFQGHGSFRIVTDNHMVIYVDPYAGDGYDLPADLVLITHEHPDHNKVELIRLKESGVILRAADMLVGGDYRTYEVMGAKVWAVPAANKHHDIAACVGYMIAVDRVTVYVAGDTSKTDYMGTHLSKESVDYALLPIDGLFNMGMDEAAECGSVIGARHVIPMHMKVNALFDEAMAAAFPAINKLVLHPGEEADL